MNSYQKPAEGLAAMVAQENKDKEKTMSSDLVKAMGNAIAPIGNMDEFMQVAKTLETSGMFGITQPGQGAVVLSTCISEGLSLMQFQRNYHIIENRPSMKADAMLANFINAGGKYKILSFTADKAEATFAYGDNEITLAMTMEDAKKSNLPFNKAGKLKENWANFPKQMLWARLVSQAIRLVAPIIVAGIYTPEEISDFGNKEKATESVKAIRIDPAAVKLEDEARPVIEAEQKPMQEAKSEQEPEPAQAEIIDTEPGRPATHEYTLPEAAYLCPCGKIEGKAWSELPDAVLQTVLKAESPAVKKAMTPEHYVALKQEIKKRS